MVGTIKPTIFCIVGIVRSNRCIDLEPVWNFEEHFYIGIIVQCQGEGEH